MKIWLTCQLQIPYIQNSPPSKILDTSENMLDSFEATTSLSTQVNLKETSKKTNDACINSNDIDQPKYVRDKIFEKAKFHKLKTIVL